VSVVSGDAIAERAAAMRSVTRKEIAEQDREMLRRQAQFRLAADAVTAALAELPEVAAVALIGSVARPLRREVPRFAPFRGARIDIWHECKDVDLAVWLDRLDGLKALQRARGMALQQLFAQQGVGVAHHQVEIFVMRAGTNDYLGRLCTYGKCPKGKRDCEVPGCGREPFLKQHAEFTFWPDALAEDRIMRLYERGRGIVRRAADTPAEGREERAEVG
jgi:hypothetical protein